MAEALLKRVRVSGNHPFLKAHQGSRRRGSGPVAWLLLCALVLALVPQAGYAESPNSLYKKGEAAAARQQYEAAYEFYKQAYDQKPQDLRYRTAYERMRFAAAMVKVHRGQLLRQLGKLQDALAEFQAAATVDASLEIATQEIAATQELIEAGGQPAAEQTPTAPTGVISELLSAAQGPVQLQPISDQPITLKLTEDTKVIYETIGKLAGINVLFDPDYTSRRIHIELNNVSLQDALQIIALESRTFWRAVTKNTIFIASDNQQKRKELQENVVKTFYLSNVSQPTDLQDVVNALRTILQLDRSQQIPSQDAIVVKGTPDQLAMAEKLIGDIDKPKAEVVVDVAVMQISRNLTRNLGVTPPSSAQVTLTPAQLGQLNNGSTNTNSSGNNNNNNNTTTTPTTSGLTFNTFKHLSSASYSVTIPSASVAFLYSNGDSKVLENPQIRALDGQKASLKIGERLPVATGSFGFPTGVVGGSTAGFTGTVNTQFQYIDVGVNIEITPTIHNDGDVTLKTSIEVSSVTGSSNIGGVTQPIIGQRKIEHEIRLKEGEVNIMGGILEDTDTTSLTGLPGLSKIPLFKYLFSETDKQRQENEIVFVMTPHLVRRQVLTALNNRAIDVGTGDYAGSVQLRVAGAQPPQPAPAAEGTPQPTAPASATASPAQNPAAMSMPMTGPTAATPVAPAPATQQPPPPPAQPQANPQPQASPVQPQGAPHAPNPGADLSAAEPGSALVRFDPVGITQPVGSTAALNVVMQTATPISAASLQLKYDSKLLQLVNVADGGFLSQDGQPATVVHRDDGAGTVQISAVRPVGAAGISGQGSMFTLVFTLKAPGTAAITPASVLARDSGGNPVITTIASPASIQIGNPPLH